MYFIDNKHKRNFETLLFRYPEYKRKNLEYLPTLYLAAFPEIYKCIDINKITGEDPGATPLMQLTNWDEEENKLIVSHEALTSGTRAMVQVGLSLFNGYPINLGRCLRLVTTKEWSDVLLEAIKIRSGNFN